MRSRLRMTAAAAGVIVTTALCLLGGNAAGAATRPRSVRPDATPPCGTYCVNYYVRRYGPSYVLKDFRSRQRPGTRVLLRLASNGSQGEDWTVWPAGTVTQLAAFGIVSRRVALHYGADQAFEIQYAPYGVGSGLCAGLADNASSGERVSLQWCGQSARTIWISDAANARGSFAPLISGSDTSFSDPQVLTGARSPRSWPSQLTSYRLQTFADGTVYDDQMWDNTIGVLP